MCNVLLNNICGNRVTFFQDYLMNNKFKRTLFFNVTCG